ncbi:MAG: GntR family transcriptional regulator [Boseongicola sp.]|nr:GntR family transcriptional regulator [Boseongicola sp.]NNL19502.1 GntR family transcriptional regulator [Boseongicola sp.]
MDLAIEPLEKQAVSATDQVFDALYSAVISIKLPPGAKVSEAEIAKQLGVSRQPVRDAFFRLSNLGFLSIRPQRATVITQISLRAVADAVFTRTALEVECLRTALTNDPVLLVKALDASLTAQAESLRASRDNFHALDEAFHEAICIASGHAHVWSLIREQKAHLDRIRYLTLSLERRNHVIQDHQSILEAIIAKDLQLSESRLRAHIGDVLNAAPEIQKQRPEYFEKTPEK